MLFYAYTSLSGDPDIVAGVTIGSPVSFNEMNHFMKKLCGYGETFKNWGVLHISNIIRFLTPLIGRVNMKWARDQMNPDNIDMQFVRSLSSNAVSNVSTRLLYQFSRWIITGKFDSIDGSYDYREKMSEIKIPALVMSGGDDRLASVPSVKMAFEKLGSADKKYVEASVKNGFSANYGHIDLVFGKRVQTEIFPLIGNWIDEHRVSLKAEG
jgi:pimeloyl-ACP methyl ester carboxylesterase